MRKIITLLTVFVAFIILLSGCAKPKGTFICDNYTEYSMSVSWCGYGMGVDAYGYSEYTVNAGGGTASIYANGYGDWGSIYVNVPADGYSGVEMYWYKSTDKSTSDKGLKIKKEKGSTTKKTN